MPSVIPANSRWALPSGKTVRVESTHGSLCACVYTTRLGLDLRTTDARLTLSAAFLREHARPAGIAA